MRKSLIIAAALLSAPAVSQAKTLEDLLVEKGVITKAEAKSTSSDTSAAKVYWNGGTRFEFPDTGFTAGFATYLVERYTFTDADEGFGGQNTSSFEQKKARIILSGTALDNEFSYFMQADFVGEKDNDGKNGTHLRDAYVRWNACDWGAVQMGQFKTFISRQYVNSDWKTTFVDNSAASNYFNQGRQQGLAAYWWTDDKLLEFRAGIFNGSSDNEGINRPGQDNLHTGMAAVRLNPIGKMDAYDETDIDYTEDFALSLGSAYAYGAAKMDLGSGSEHVMHQTVDVDAIMKYRGFSLASEFYYAKVDSDSLVTAEPMGFYVQTGYFLEPKKFEVAARYSYIDCADGEAWGMCEGNDLVNETAVSLNYYFWKHYLKASLSWIGLNLDGTSSMDDGKDNNSSRWVFQLQSYF